MFRLCHKLRFCRKFLSCSRRTGSGGTETCRRWADLMVISVHARTYQAFGKSRFLYFPIKSQLYKFATKGCGIHALHRISEPCVYPQKSALKTGMNTRCLLVHTTYSYLAPDSYQQNQTHTADKYRQPFLGTLQNTSSTHASSAVRQGSSLDPPPPYTHTHTQAC